LTRTADALAIFAGLLVGAAGCAAALGIDEVPTPAVVDGGSPRDAGPDTPAPDDAPHPDAAVDADGGGAPACAWDTAFTTFRPLAALNTPTLDEGSARLSADERTLFFYQGARDAAAGASADLYVATRADPSQAFTAASPITELNGSATNESDPFVTGDGLSLYFSSDRAAAKDNSSFDIFVATRAAADASFDGAVKVPNASTSNADFAPWLDRTGTLWTTSGVMAPTVDVHLFYASPVGAGFAVATRDESLTTGGNELGPVLSADALTIFFGRDITGDGAQIYVGHRTAPGAFSEVKAVPELRRKAAGGGTAVDVRPTWLSADGCRLYFMSSETGTYDLWLAERAP
jgi:hypothetical protein